MIKKCRKCGRTFDAKKDIFDECYKCFTKKNAGGPSFSSNLLLITYYDESGNLLREVFIDKPKEIADKLAADGLSTKQLRDFHLAILRARNKAILKGMQPIRPLLYECYRDIEYQLKRQMIPKSFAEFVQHHLKLAEVSEESLEGFFQHLDSIVCYFPSTK